MFITKSELDQIYSSLQARDTYLDQLSRKLRSLEQTLEKHTKGLDKVYTQDVRLLIVEKNLTAITEYLQVKYVYIPPKYIAEGIK